MDRYHRQTLLEGIGPEGQRRLGESHAVVVGCGALGCVAGSLLARAGVGRLTLIDRDVVELTNLQRQILYDEGDARDGTPKAEAARARLAAINSEITIEAHVADFEYRNAERLIGTPDVIVDGTDNFETRYLLNDIAVKHTIPYVYGGAVATTGMSMVIMPGTSPCLRCVFEEPPPPGSAPTCDTVGVLGPTVMITAAWQAGEALKILTGNIDKVSTTLLEFDQWNNQRRRLELASMKRGDCPCCARREFSFLDGTRGGATEHLCGIKAVQIAPPHSDHRVDLAALAARLAPHGEFTCNAFVVRGTLRDPVDGGERGGCELMVFADGRAIIKGTDRADVARSIYAKYVGA